MTGDTPSPLDVLRDTIDRAPFHTHDVARAALADVEALAEAAQALLKDDDMPNHWDDCVCSYCVRNWALRAALVPFAAHKDTT